MGQRWLLVFCGRKQLERHVVWWAVLPVRGAWLSKPPRSQHLPVASASTSSLAAGASWGKDYSITLILHTLHFDGSLNFPLLYTETPPLHLSFCSTHPFSFLWFSHCSALTGRLAFFISPPSPHRPFSILLVLLQSSPPPPTHTHTHTHTHRVLSFFHAPPSPVFHTPCLSLWVRGFEREKGAVIKDKDERKPRETNTKTNKPLSKVAFSFTVMVGTSLTENLSWQGGKLR